MDGAIAYLAYVNNLKHIYYRRVSDSDIVLSEHAQAYLSPIITSCQLSLMNSQGEFSN